jgi:rhodanese-related sulfurtransferase
MENRMHAQRPDPTAQRIPEVTVREAWNQMTSPARHTALIDVRETWEYQEGHAKDAISIPLSELEQRIAEVPRDRDLLLICHSGYRSLVAGKFLRTRGIAQVANVLGGTDEWERAGLPMVWGAH